MKKEFLIMMTFYIAGLVFVSYNEPLSQTTCYVLGWLSYAFYLGNYIRKYTILLKKL